MISLSDFAHKSNKNFRLGTKLSKVPEPRKEPQVPLWMGLGWLIYGAAMGMKSLLQMDQMARTGEARKFCQSKRRMVTSDCWYWRVLPQVEQKAIAQLQREVGVQLRQQGHQSVKLPGGRKVRVGVVDGTVWGGREVSVLDFLGGVDSLVDLELSDGKGKELPTSQRLLQRQGEVLGPGFVDYMLGDGLYITQQMFRLCRQDLKVHLVVKTTEVGSLDILKDANALFDARDGVFDREIEVRQGVDLTRGLKYRVEAAGGFQFVGVPFALKVARVTERPLKQPQAKPETFWVVTDDLEIGAEDLRELGHLRWSIENRGFKALNALAHSKYVWVRTPDTSNLPEPRHRFEVLVRLLCVAYMLVQAYAATLEQVEVRREFAGIHLTVGFLSRRWLMTLGEASFWEGLADSG